MAQYVPEGDSEQHRVLAAEGDALFRNRFELGDDASVADVVAVVEDARLRIAGDPALGWSAAVALGNAVTASSGEWCVVMPDRPEVQINGQGVDLVGVVDAICSGRTRPIAHLEQLIEQA